MNQELKKYYSNLVNQKFIVALFPFDPMSIGTSILTKFKSLAKTKLHLLFSYLLFRIYVLQLYEIRKAK
jgi:hypothetical protein